MKPLIDRLKAERQDMLEKLDAVRTDLRYHRDRRNGAAIIDTRKRHATEHARAAANFFRMQDRLTELKAQITAENIRLTAALVEAKAAARKLARAGSNSVPEMQK